MKKSVIAILLSGVLCCSLVSFAGCKVGKPDKNGFFSQRTLDRNLIPDLPKIKKPIEETNFKNGTFSYNTTESEYRNYVGQVFEYLSSCGFTYFGTAKEEISNFFGGAQRYSFEAGTELNDFGQYCEELFGDSTDYFFVWGNELTESSIIEGSYYMEMGHTIRSEGGYRAYISLSYYLMDYTFYVQDEVAQSV